MSDGMHYEPKFNRMDRIKERLIQCILRLRPENEPRKPMVSITGDVISDVIRAEGLFERESLKLLRDCFLDGELCKNQVALDVGANIGNHTLFFADLFQKVIAFEPNPIARAMLEINLELNRATNVEIQSAGLSDRAGRVALSFDTQNLGATRSVANPDEAHDSRQIELAVGDQIVTGDQHIGLIKIDVEGAEDAVLRGLQGTIEKHEPLIAVEQLKETIDPVSGTSPAFAFLRDRGFTAWDYQPVRLGKPLGRLISLIEGHSKFRVHPVDRLESRDYYALIFTPPSYVFPQRKQSLP